MESLESTQTSAETTTEAQPSSVQATQPAAGQSVQPDAYTPDFKFKVMGEEKEIDEWIRPVVKDKELERKVKDLYEKAHGLDYIKPKHQELKSQNEEIRLKYQQQEAALHSLGNYVREGDFDSFYDALGIPKQKVLEYALELVKREQMSPEQKAQWEAGRQARESAKYYEQQNALLQQSQQQFAVQQRTFELERALDQPEVRVFQEAYNTGMSNPTAFRDYVVQIGQAYAARGQDIPAGQAVAEAVRHLKAMNPSLGSVQQNNHVVTATSKPTIPNMGGRGTSAVKPAIKSIDDLKRRARELSGQDIYN